MRVLLSVCAVLAVSSVRGEGFPYECRRGEKVVVTDTIGELSYPGIRTHRWRYEPNENRCWRFSCETSVTVTWDRVDTEEGSDFVETYSRKGSQYYTRDTQMSGDISEEGPISYEGDVVFRFVSDRSVEKTGFDLTFVCGTAAPTSNVPTPAPPTYTPSLVQFPESCVERNVMHEDGSISHLGYVANENVCWLVQCDGVVGLSFTAFETELHYDVLTVSQYEGSTPAVVKEMSGPLSPFVVSVAGHVLLQFVSDYAIQETGFVVSHTCGAQHTSAAPATDAPATDPPATNPPATDPPATNPPATNPPATDPPATNPPATDPPATNPPATNPPATDPPATNPPDTIAPTNAPAPPGYPDVCFGTSGDIGIDDEWLWSDSLSVGGVHCWRYAVCSAGSLSKFTFNGVGGQTFSIYNEAGTLIDTVTAVGTKYYPGNVIIHVTLPDVIPSFNFGWSCATTDAPATNPPDTIAPTNAPAPPGYPDVCFGTSGDIGIDDEWLWSDSLSVGGAYCWRYAVCSAGSLSKFTFNGVGGQTFSIYNEAGTLIDTVTAVGTKYYPGNVIIHVTLPDVIPSFNFGWSCATTDAPATNPPATNPPATDPPATNPPDTIAPTNAPAPPGYPDVCFGTSGDIGIDDEWLWSDSLSVGGAYCWRYAVCSAGSLSKFTFNGVGGQTFSIYNEAGTLIDTVTAVGTKYYPGNVIIHVTLPDVIPSFNFGWSCATTDAPATNPPDTIAPTNAPAPPGYPDVCFGTSGDIGIDDEWLWSDSLSVGGVHCWRYAVCSAGSLSKFTFNGVGGQTFSIYNEAGTLIDTVTAVGTKYYLGNVIIHVTLPDVIPSFNFGWSCATTDAPATNPPDTIAPTNAPAPPGYPDVCFGTSGDIGVDDEWLWSDSLSVGGAYCWRYAVCSAGSLSKFTFNGVGGQTFSIYNEAGTLIDTVTAVGTKYYPGNVIIHVTLPDVIPSFNFGWSCATTDAPATNPPDTIAPTNAPAPPGYPDVCFGTSGDIGIDDEWLWSDFLSVGGVHCWRYAVCSAGSLSKFTFNGVGGQTFSIYNEAGTLIDTVTAVGTKYYPGNVIIHVTLPDVIPSFNFGWSCATTDAPATNPPDTIAPTNAPAPPGYPDVCFGTSGDIGIDDEWLWSDFLSVGGVHCWRYAVCSAGSLSKFTFNGVGGQTFSIYNEAGTLIDTVTAVGTKYYPGNVIIHVTLPDVIPSFNFGWSCATTDAPATNPPDTIAPTNAPVPEGYPDVCHASTLVELTGELWYPDEYPSAQGPYCFRVVCDWMTQLDYEHETGGMTVYEADGSGFKTTVITASNSITSHVGSVVFTITDPDDSLLHVTPTCLSTAAPTNAPPTPAPTHSACSGGTAVDITGMWYEFPQPDMTYPWANYCWRFTTCAGTTQMKFDSESPGPVEMYDADNVMTVLQQGATYSFSGDVVFVLSSSANFGTFFDFGDITCT